MWISSHKETIRTTSVAVQALAVVAALAFGIYEVKFSSESKKREQANYSLQLAERFIAPELDAGKQALTEFALYSDPNFVSENISATTAESAEYIRKMRSLINIQDIIYKCVKSEMCDFSILKDFICMGILQQHALLNHKIQRSPYPNPEMSLYILPSNPFSILRKCASAIQNTTCIS